MKLLLVMLGGFLGAVSRFTLGEWIQTESGFPLATLSINLFGCFILSWFLTFITLRKSSKPEFTLFIGTGFIGSFTTFSTFSVETVLLFNNGLTVYGVIYIVASIFFGVLLAYIGYKIARIKRG
ncbi:fluoride efflux transporter CrcB [Neobacillus niacini]|uniref:fluoride efflux transporter CrcB n=1 Tax=Neobacillus niacini TaxID=86668 RepID=UPI002FFF0D50